MPPLCDSSIFEILVTLRLSQRAVGGQRRDLNPIKKIAVEVAEVRGEVSGRERDHLIFKAALGDVADRRRVVGRLVTCYGKVDRGGGTGIAGASQYDLVVALNGQAVAQIVGVGGREQVGQHFATCAKRGIERTRRREARQRKIVLERSTLIAPAAVLGGDLACGIAAEDGATT